MCTNISYFFFSVQKASLELHGVTVVGSTLNITSKELRAEVTDAVFDNQVRL